MVDPGVLMVTGSLIKLHGVLSLVVLLKKYKNYAPYWLAIVPELVPLTEENVHAFLGVSEIKGLAFSDLSM